MTVCLRERGIHALVLDIEGTTTPIAFVYDVLFPFARAHLVDYLREHLLADEVRAAIERLRVEWTGDVKRGEAPPDWLHSGSEPSLAPIVAYLEWLMDRDRKSPALKWLQGAIWDRGYRAGELKGEVFEDVRPALKRWFDGGIRIAIYSSGSELAQRRLFGTTPEGDLTRFITRFFDTAIGSKTSADSYRRIAQAMQSPPEEMLFVSDVAAELDAARSAGWSVALCIRPRALNSDSQTPTPESRIPSPESRVQNRESATPVVHRFDEIVL